MLFNCYVYLINILLDMSPEALLMVARDSNHRYAENRKNYRLFHHDFAIFCLANFNINTKTYYHYDPKQNYFYTRGILVSTILMRQLFLFINEKKNQLISSLKSSPSSLLKLNLSLRLVFTTWLQVHDWLTSRTVSDKLNRNSY